MQVAKLWQIVYALFAVTVRYGTTLSLRLFNLVPFVEPQCQLLFVGRY